LQTRRITLRPMEGSWWAIFTALLLLFWGALWLLTTRLPLTLSLPIWWPRGSVIFRLTPTSWPYAQALTALALAILLTSPVGDVTRWQAWGGTLLLLFGGLAAVTAANPLTLVLSWLVLDALELTTLSLQIHVSALREQIVAIFSARLTSILLFLWVSAHYPLGFDSLPGRWNAILLLAVGMRLGVFPLHIPFLQDAAPRRRGLGTMLRLTAPIASLGLLVQISANGFPAGWVAPLNWAAFLAGLFAALFWVTADDELAGRPFWVLGMAALSIHAALQSNLQDSVTWGVVMLLGGGLIFLSSLRDATLMWVPLLATTHLLGLPYTLTGGITHASGHGLWMIGGWVVQVLMVVGYIRHLWPVRVVLPAATGERILYAFGMIVLLVSAWGIPGLSGWRVGEIHLSHPIAFAFAGGLWLLVRKRITLSVNLSRTWLGHFLSLNWLYLLIWRVYTLLSRIAETFTQVLEGEGGLLWMLVILLVLLSAFQFAQGGTP